MNDAAQKARALYEARRTGVPIPPFTDSEPHLGMADGYAVQQELVGMLLAEGDQVIGHKVGVTSAAAQRLFGIDTPDYGPVLASTAFGDGDAIELDRFIAPKLEAEIVFVLGDRLRGPGVTREQVLRAVAGALPALEIVDSRIADWRIGLADTVADLASNGAMVTAGEPVPLQDWDPRLLGMSLSRDGAFLDSGAGAAALGDPLAVVAWLADVLATNGTALEPGHVVMTGALHTPVPMSPGEEYLAEFDRIGSVRVRTA